MSASATSSAASGLARRSARIISASSRPSPQRAAWAVRTVEAASGRREQRAAAVRDRRADARGRASDRRCQQQGVRQPDRSSSAPRPAPASPPRPASASSRPADSASFASRRAARSRSARSRSSAPHLSAQWPARHAALLRSPGQSPSPGHAAAAFYLPRSPQYTMLTFARLGDVSPLGNITAGLCCRDGSARSGRSRRHAARADCPPAQRTAVQPRDRRRERQAKPEARPVRSRFQSHEAVQDPRPIRLGNARAAIGDRSRRMRTPYSPRRSTAISRCLRRRRQRSPRPHGGANT